jgi:hypothetical protein
MRRALYAMFWLGYGLVSAGCVAGEEERLGSVALALDAPAAFSVDFSGCKEYVGQVPASYADARELVPDAYVPTMGATGNATLSIRVVDCEGISVDGGAASPGALSQIGFDIASPDGSGFINTHLLWYATDSPNLMARLREAGVPAQMVQHLSFGEPSEVDGAFEAVVPHPAEPSFSVVGTMTEPFPGPAVPFIANWWAIGQHGEVKMQTTFPELYIGGGSAAVVTSASSELGELVGGATTPFTILNLSARFEDAHMETAVSP